MAIVDVARKTITRELGHGGDALGGKTTNLTSLHKPTARARGRQPDLHTVSPQAVAQGVASAAQSAPHVASVGFEHLVDTAAYRRQRSGGDIQRRVIDQEPPFDEAEQSFWSSTASLLALALHWRALRKKMASPEPASVPATGVSK